MPNWITLLEGSKELTVTVHLKHGDRYYGKLFYDNVACKWWVRSTDEQSQVHRCYFDPENIVTFAVEE